MMEHNVLFVFGLTALSVDSKFSGRLLDLYRLAQI